MDNTRFQRVEAKVAKHAVILKNHQELLEVHSQRHNDTANIIGSHTTQLQAQAMLIETIQRSTQVQEDILKALNLLGKFAKWVLAVAGLIGIIVTTVNEWRR